MNFDFSKIKENPKITKEEILLKLGEKQIMEKYIGGSIYDSPILSPLREENNPSFSIKELDNGNIIWRDWGTGKHGDCFNFIQEKYNCTFQESLNIIATDFKLNGNNNISNTCSLFSESVENSNKAKVSTKEKSIIIIKEQPFTLTDKLYWQQFGIRLSTLALYDVYSVKNLWLFKGGVTKLNKNYSNTNPIYAYRFTNFKYYNYKIYQPLENKYNKWIFNGNSTDIEGHSQLPMYGDLLIIGKAMKDVMSLYEIGIPAISLQGEHNKLDNELFTQLYNRFDRIMVLYDNDQTGIEAAKKLTDQYPIESIIIPDEYESKDFSDLIRNIGLNKSKKVLNKLINE